MSPRSITYLALCLSVVGCGGSDPVSAADAPITPDVDAASSPPDASTVVVLPTGTVTDVTYLDQCAGPEAPIGDAAAGFRCAQLTIACPGLDDATVQVGLAPTPAATSKGTITTHAGGGGNGFMRGEVAQGLYGMGWDLAQIAWDAPWECPMHEGRQCARDTTPVASRLGIKDAACRPATVMKWIREAAERRDGSLFVAAAAPMCGHGFSGGSGAFWYALAHYGGSAYVDYALLGASTPFSRIDIGCDPSYATTTVAAACDNMTGPEVPLNYNSNGAGADDNLNTWFSTDACDVTPTADELALYARGSIVSTGADLAFATPVTSYVCVDDATVNVVPGLGRYMVDAVHANDPGGDRFKAMCSTSCQGEGVFGDPAMRDAAIAELDASCVVLP